PAARWRPGWPCWPKAAPRTGCAARSACSWPPRGRSWREIPGRRRRRTRSRKAGCSPSCKAKPSAWRCSRFLWRNGRRWRRLITREEPSGNWPKSGGWPSARENTGSGTAPGTLPAPRRTWEGRKRKGADAGADIGGAVSGEWWVDYLPGRRTRDQALRLERYRAGCPVCAERCRRWGELLRNARVAGMRAAASNVTAARNAHSGGETRLFAALRSLAGVWRRKWRRGSLRLAVSAYSWRRSLERALRAAAGLRWIAAAGGILALALVAGLVRAILMTYTKAPPDEPCHSQVAQ